MKAMRENFSKLTLQHKTIICFGIIIFLFQSLQQQQKTWKRDTYS